MSLRRSRPRPTLIIPHRKHVDLSSPSNLGSLSPDLQPNSPPTFPTSSPHVVSTVGRYVLVEQEGSSVYRATHSETLQHYLCKVVDLDQYRETLSAYWRLDAHENINDIEEILLGKTKAYIFFSANHGDLHSYVRSKRKLRESEAKRLFAQIVMAISHCHQNGVVLRDIKLRKFVFKDQERTQLMLEGLQDVYLLEDEADDRLADKHGCPAYVSPEILHTAAFYSGKSADVWSLGVMLYTMLVGRYPFHDSEPSGLFSKIRRGQFSVPDSVSSKARCLLRSLLRREPTERLTADEILQHPWFGTGSGVFNFSSVESTDQTVPDVAGAAGGPEELPFFVGVS